MEQVKYFRARLGWVLAMAAIYLVAAGVECICGLSSSSLLGVNDLTPRAQMMGGVLAVLAGLSSFAVLIAYIIAGIIFLILLHRACSQAITFSHPFKECSPGLAVGYWFIPFANLAMPHQVMMDLLRSSAESAGRRFDGLVIHLWWLAFLAKALFGAAMFIMSPRHPQTVPELAKVELWVGIGGALGFTAAASFMWMLYNWRPDYLQALQRREATMPAGIVASEQSG